MEISGVLGLLMGLGRYNLAKTNNEYITSNTNKITAPCLRRFND